jgi:hypothetical protein
MDHKMEGQWIGVYAGTNTGCVTLNLEFIENIYTGIVVLVDEASHQYPWLMAAVEFEAAEKNRVIARLSKFSVLHPQTFLPVDWHLIENIYPGVTIPNDGTLDGILNGCKITGKWQTNIGTKGTFEVNVSEACKPSSRIAEQMTWEEFKMFSSTLDKKKYIFRGQSRPWRLRTLYHRMGRSNLVLYTANDVRMLHRHICAVTNRFFNLSDALEHGALLNLAQHYGYPTPLLDWTRSPFVAAYFAYSFLSLSKDNTGKIRIFILDAANWRNDTLSVSHVESPILTLTILELMAINNDRAIPQQSVTTFSNVDDIESFIRFHENRTGKTYLKIIELPASEKKSVLRDLSYMGVSGSSLFPGLDGVCRMLKEIFF